MDGRVGSRKGLQEAGGLGCTQGQGSSVSGRAGGLSGLLQQGRGVQGEMGETPLPPELQGGFLCSLPGRRHAGLTCLYLQVFLNLELLYPPGDPPPVDQWLRLCPPLARGQGSIPGQDIEDPVCCNEDLVQPNK